MLRRVVKFQFAQDAPRFFRRKGVVKGSGRVGVEIVQYNPENLGTGKMHVHQLFHAVGKIDLFTLLSRFHFPPTGQRLTHNEQISRSLAFVFVVVTPHLSGLHR